MLCCSCWDSRILDEEYSTEVLVIVSLVDLVPVAVKANMLMYGARDRSS